MNRFAILLVLLQLALSACSVLTGAATNERQLADSRLQAVLDARSEQLKVRDSSRHPAATIQFMGLMPGMRIAEVLPGGGWYTEILAPYIGSEGAIYGLNYADHMWPMFGFMNDEVIARRIASMERFPEQVAAIAGEGMTARGLAFDRVPDELNGSLDAVVMIRALHNLNRFEQRAATRTRALVQINKLLKPGGIVGVVQHRAPANADDNWANGSNGYLKQAEVIAMFELAGFELVATSEINANPHDRPGRNDQVWRLPPSLRTDADHKAAMMAIGESDRMTLKFKKIN